MVELKNIVKKIEKIFKSVNLKYIIINQLKI